MTPGPMGAPVERAHRGRRLQALYPLQTRVPVLARVPVPARRITRRALTRAAVRAHLARCRRVTIVGIHCRGPQRAVPACPACGHRARVICLERVEQAAETLERELRKGDVVLLHGSTNQHLERVKMLLDGDDVRCLVRGCSYHWSCTGCPYVRSGAPARVVEAA